MYTNEIIVSDSMFSDGLPFCINILSFFNALVHVSIRNNSYCKRNLQSYCTSLFCLLNFIFSPMSSLFPFLDALPIKQTQSVKLKMLCLLLKESYFSITSNTTFLLELSTVNILVVGSLCDKKASRYSWKQIGCYAKPLGYNMCWKIIKRQSLRKYSKHVYQQHRTKLYFPWRKCNKKQKSWLMNWWNFRYHKYFRCPLPVLTWTL